jgi:zinc transporter ZupT
MRVWLQLLILGLLAAGGNLLGGLLIARGSATRTGLKRLVAIGAGFMLAAVVLEAIPEIVEIWPNRTGIAMVWLLSGYLLIQLAEHALAPHLHFGEEVHPEEVGRRGVATTAVLALTIHAFFDGVTIASGILTSLRLGVFLSLAVLIHKLPEGFTVASIVLSSGQSERTALRATILVAVATFAGIVLVVIAQPLLTYTLPLSAGVTLYVAASDLIPEVNHEGGVRASLLVLAGVALFYIVKLVLQTALGV